MGRSYDGDDVEGRGGGMNRGFPPSSVLPPFDGGHHGISVVVSRPG